MPDRLPRPVQPVGPSLMSHITATALTVWFIAFLTFLALVTRPLWAEAQELDRLAGRQMEAATPTRPGVTPVEAAVS
jgi:hypothetical protein